MKKTIHMISHTHWDREWYFTTLDTQVLALKGFREILKVLENDPEIAYHLDGQSSLLEDYLSLRPEDSELAKKLIREKRLFIGPWYTQPDFFNVHGESIFRNIKYGKEYAAKMGHSMNVFYIPDSFGVNCQIPQISKAYEIDNIILRRGYDDKYMGGVEMMWKALNDDSIKTAVMPFGYSIVNPAFGGRFRDFNREHVEIESLQVLEKVKSLSKDNNIMCLVGGDQVSMDDNIKKTIELVSQMGNDEYIHSTYEKYMDSLQAAADNEYKGEFRYPRYSRVHKTITSSRYDIKKSNHDVEQFLIRIVEPLIYLAQKKGIDAPIEMLDKGWKMLLESQAHDSMGGCNSDDTNRDVLSRCASVMQIGKSMYNLIAKTIVNNIDKEDIFLLFNGSNNDTVTSSNSTLITSEKEFSIRDMEGNPVEFAINSQIKKKHPRVVIQTPDGEKETMQDSYYYINNIDVIDAPVHPLSYKIFQVCYQNLNRAGEKKLSDSADCHIENEFYLIQFRDKNIHVTDKINNIKYSKLLTFRDSSDDGDLYDFSPLPDEKVLEFDQFTLNSVKKSHKKSLMNLELKCKLPEGLKEDRKGRSERTLDFLLNIQVELKDDMVRLNMDCLNNIRDHKLSLMFNTGIKSHVAAADVPFGFIQRKKDLDLLNNWKGYTEYPVDIEPMQNSVSHFDGERSFSVYAKGIKEYQLHDAGVEITLFKSVGYVGKNDLHFRPGRASGRTMESPDGQLLKNLSFQVAFTSQKEFSQLETAVTTEKFLNDFHLYQKQNIEREIQRIDNFDIWINPSEVSYEEKLLDFQLNKDIIFSSIDLRPTETLVRVFNPTENNLSIPEKFQERICNALGNRIEKDLIGAYDHLNIKL